MKKIIFNKKILIYLTLFSFSLVSFVPTAFAQTQYQNTPPLQQNTKPTTPVASDEQGQILPFHDIFKFVCKIPGNCLIDDVIDAMFSLPGKVAGAIKDIVLEIIKHLLILLASLFGFAADLAENAFTTNDICTQQGRESTACNKALANYKDYTEAVASQPANSFNMIGFAWMGIATAYQSIPAFNPVDYLAYEFKNNILGIQTASAQGIGTSTLSPQPIIDLWQKMRNLAYIVMVLILVVIGFLVLFRFRLDPRTTLTATMAIPRVTIALILITFSFALSGLFIDLIYVIVNLISQYFDIPLNIANPFRLFWSTVPNSIFAAEAWIGSLVIPIAGPLAIIVMVLIELIIRLILFGIAVFIFISLLTRFATLIILTIFAPLFFLWGALPGQEDTTSGWFKRMTVNAISFPAILLILGVSLKIINLGTIQIPPPLWAGANNLLNFSTLIGYGVMFFATRVPALLEDALRVTPSAHAARAGTGPGQIGRRVPLVGGMFR